MTKSSPLKHKVLSQKTRLTHKDLRDWLQNVHIHDQVAAGDFTLLDLCTLTRSRAIFDLVELNACCRSAVKRNEESDEEESQLHGLSCGE
jgi:hypothetical protein